MAMRRSGPRRPRPETTGELGARLNIFERKLAELERRLGLQEGNARNFQSALDDMRMSRDELVQAWHTNAEAVEGGARVLVKQFVKELREERRRLSQALTGLARDFEEEVD